MVRTPEPITWLSLVDISGPFLAGAVLEDAFPQGLEKIETPRRQRLRAAYEEWQDAIDENDPHLSALHEAWIRMVLEEGLEFDDESLSSRDALAGSIVYRSAEQGIEHSPDFAVRPDAAKPSLLVTVYPPGTNLENLLPRETWAASPAERMTLLCRASDCRVGLITNGEQWMLVNAPIGETSGYASWYARLWWQEPVTLKAFQSLLGVRRCFGPEEETLSRLLERSLEFQEEVTNTLGEQVRRAVEVLIQSLGRADQDRNGELLKDVKPSELYEAGLTVMMRLVFLLSAEERGLLLLGDPLYDQHYAISTLRARLREDADQYGVEVLERRHDAWSRLLAAFRGIYGGIEHEALRLPALGGSLFDPDRFPLLEGRAPGTSWREQPATPLPIDNRTVLLLMTALQVIEQKGGAQLLSYRALDVEQIGHVYEGLLEFTAARVPETTLGLIGTKKLPNPQITLSELDSWSAKGEKAQLDHLKGQTGRSLAALRKAVNTEETKALLISLVQACNGDEQLARHLMPFGDLIRADSWGNLLIYRQGSFAIVKGTDRRSSGTHYTPRSLTEPIVRYTLEPLVYVGPAEGHPQAVWKLKSSSDILALNVCDMACGSGAFLVEACRYLSLRLVEAWINEEARGMQISIDGIARESLGENESLPKLLDDRLLVARRLVAQSCLYGVDINHLAVELAKLAIWLVTLAKNKPFSFLDHAIRCGDSLIGIHDLEQLRFFSLKPDSENPVLFKGPLNTAVNEAIELRLELEGKPADTVADVETQVRLLAEADDDVARLKSSADLLVAAEFWGKSNSDKQERIRQAAVKSAYYVDKGPTEELQQIAAKELRGQKTFHWPLEFPEVVVNRDGFDALVGNPPFMGGKKITGSMSVNFRDFVVSHVASDKAGVSDVCAYFFLRAHSLLREGGCFGLIATNTIAQGDTREVGLDQISSSNSSIFRAISSRAWPGRANLAVSEIWVRREGWNGSFYLDDRVVRSITSMLTEPGSVVGFPHRLPSLSGKSYQGSVVLGTGFMLSLDEAAELLRQDAKHAEIIHPYLSGDDLNSRPDQSASRRIINFFDWPLDRTTCPPNYKGPVASDFPACLAIVRSKVKPQREKSKRKVYRERWWQYAEKQTALYESIRHLPATLVIPETTKYCAFAVYPTNVVFSHMTKVITIGTDDVFALLSSSVHEAWARHYASTLETRLKYTTSDVFETFPFARSLSTLIGIGSRYRTTRSHLMAKNCEGITDTYNRFHNSDEPSADIQTLRELHIEMDEAVAAAYGWTDLDLDHGFHETKQGIRFTISETARRDVLQRLLKLNHERYEEELAQGLHEKQKRSRVSQSDAQTEMFDGGHL